MKKKRVFLSYDVTYSDDVDASFSGFTDSPEKIRIRFGGVVADLIDKMYWQNPSSNFELMIIHDTKKTVFKADIF